VTEGGERPRDDVASLLCALSYATGFALGERMEHGLRTAYIGLRIADRLGAPEADREAAFYGALLKDAGCTAGAAIFSAFFPDDVLVPKLDFMSVDPARLGDVLGWLGRNVPVDSRFPARVAGLAALFSQWGSVIKEAMAGHCEIAELFARRLGFSDQVQRSLRFQWERWDGKGVAYHLRGDRIPLGARILHAAQMLELVHSFGGIAAARTLARDQRGRRFDPAVADAFLGLADDEHFRTALEREGTEDEILALRPATAADRVGLRQLDTVCEAIADLIDVKTKRTHRHSRRVGELAASTGAQLGLRPAEAARLRRVGLVHDLGMVAVPFGILAKSEPLAESERAIYELHPYYTQRVLERVAPLRDLASDASAHHERLDGHGYHRRLTGEQLSREARILAVADAYARLESARADRGDGAQQAALLQDMRDGVGTRFDADAVEALSAALTGAPARPRAAPRPQAGGLTERETEVLRLAALGLSTKEIAAKLVLSAKTVEHHLEHIYDKLDVTSRTAAVVYALHEGIAD